MSAGHVSSVYRLCEQSGFHEFMLNVPPTATARKNILYTSSIIQRASGASLKLQENNQSLLLHISGDTAARKAAAIYALYRATLPEADKYFNFNLLDDKALCKKLFVPPQYNLKAVRSVLFAGKAIFDKSAELGCLFDVTFFDERQIIILSRFPERRDAFAAWIREKAEGTTIAAPPLSEQLAHQRTIRCLVDEYGFEAQLATRAVSELKDKGDLEAAVHMVLELKDCTIGGVPERVSVDVSDTDPDVSSSHSEASVISNARTSRMTPSQLSFEAAVTSSPVRNVPANLNGSVAFPPLEGAAKTNKPAAITQLTAPKTKAVAPNANGCSSPPTSPLRTDECVVCMDAEAEFAFLPCGHRCACETCAQAVKTNHGTCPMCSTRIELSAKIFV